MVRRLVGQLFLSAAAAVVTAVLLTAFLERLTRGTSGWLRTFGRMLVDALGAPFVLAAVSFALFLVYMALLNWRRYRYMEELNRSVARIAGGRFGEALPVRQANEVGQLAVNVNALVSRLTHAMEEERRAEQTKTELVTNVSHDLRTPLTSIIGYLGLIEQDRYRDEVELRHYVQIAYAKSQRLHRLIQDLFEFARMSSGSVALRLAEVNLAEMMRQLLEHYRLPLAQAGMAGELHVHGETDGVRVLADPDKLVRVMENLLANAMTYGRDGKRVDIRLSREDQQALVEVVNYGEPIPARDLPYLFERFYRVDKARSGDDGGSGLGLAIVKGLVEKHGGTIQVYSDERYTAFQIRLPMAQGAD